MPHHTATTVTTGMATFPGVVAAEPIFRPEDLVGFLTHATMIHAW